ncbi:MAG: cytochrome c biogenesis protein ResB [Candidatus Omnitrophica bacterium]|nr:cytochrome c biogenesis protein ResB [Candidatus Omnitrophota bacterium]
MSKVTSPAPPKNLLDASTGTIDTWADPRSMSRAEAKAWRRKRNPLRPDGFPGKVFDFLASLELAVFLLIVLGTACVFGTIYESNYTAQLAKRLVYRTGWFDFLLATIFINVVFATLSRYPWRLSQLGWLVTHVGVLSIIAGSVFTYRFGVEGNMMLQEGQSSDRISLPNSYISIQKVDSAHPGEEVWYRLDSTEIEWGHPSPENPQHYSFDDLGVNLTVQNFYADSEWTEEWKNDSPRENPAVLYAIESSFAGTMASKWLAPNMPGRTRDDLGIASVTARVMDSQEDLEAELSPVKGEDIDTNKYPKGYLEVSLRDSPATTINVAEALGNKIAIEGTPYSLLLQEQYDYAYINEGGELVDNPSRAPNPLVRYEVYEGDKVVMERQFNFAFIPEFNQMHGGEVELPLEVTYHYPKMKEQSSGGRSEFAILIGPGENELHWKVASGEKISSGTMEVGKPVPMPMMTAGMSLVVKEKLTHAKIEEVLEEKQVKRGDFRRKAAEIVVSNADGDQKSIWLSHGGEQRILLGKNVYALRYLSEEFPLGFTIRLDDFRLRTYPGGSSPMSYESDVTVAYAEENSNVQKEVLIQMNEPMDQNGFRVFQSSFIDQPKGDPRISIFSIAKDPGVPIIYTGSIVLCVGIAMMFYGRKYLRKLEKKWYPQRMSGAAS